MLLWIEGFEAFGSSPGSPTGVTNKYNTTGSTTNMTLIAGRVGGLALKPHNDTGGSSIAPPSFGNVASWVVGFGMRPGNALISTRLISWYDSSSEQFTLRMTSAGELAVYRGTTLIATSSGAVGIGVNSWCFIEVKLTIGNAGAYEVRLNGVNVLSDGSEDTQQTANAYAQTIRFWGTFDSSAGNQIAYDDIYIADQTAGEVDDFIGSHKVVTIYPDGDGAATDLTPTGGGSHYTQVDENPHDGDSTYVQSAVDQDEDLYDFQDVVLSDIKGIQINAVCRETDATPFSLRLLCQSDMTLDTGSDISIGSTTYVTRHRILEADPDTTAAWTDTGISAAQFGIRVIA